MPSTIVSPLVHSPDEFSIVAMPDNETTKKIVDIQSQLSSLLGDAIWLTPPNALHSTLMEIICDTTYEGMSRKEHFEHWYERYNDKAREVIATLQPFDVTFDELIVSPGAIILKASDTSAFNTIRKALLDQTVLPVQTKIPPDITHTSIARYNKAIDVDIAREQVSSIKVAIKLHITEFKLMTDLGPDFHPSVIQTYSLRK